MLKQKALTRTLTATLCTTTNTCFIHKHKKAHKTYTQNSVKIIRNLNAQQQAAFNALPQTYMQSAKHFFINALANKTLLKS